MAVTRRDDQFIGLLSLMNVLEYHWLEEHNLLMEEAATDTQLTVSRDGFHWDRVSDRQTFLPLGAPNQWDSAWLVTQHSIVYDDDQMLFFYDATNKGRGDMPAWNKKSSRTSNFRIGVAQLPRDRFQALRPRKLHLDGIIETKPLDIVEDSDLKLNVDATHGQVEVELVDYDGTTIEGFSRTDCTAIEDNNGLDIPVRWGDRMIAQATGMAAARPPHVRVRIYLKQASLFAADLPDENPWPIPREYGTTSDLEHLSLKA